MARKKRKLSLQSQRRCLEEATKYLDIGIELVAKALDYVKMAELTDASIVREFQSTFDKLCMFSASLNGHIMRMYFEKRIQQQRRKAARRRGVPLQ
jgi:hypothetical protein